MERSKLKQIRSVAESILSDIKDRHVDVPLDDLDDEYSAWEGILDDVTRLKALIDNQNSKTAERLDAMRRDKSEGIPPAACQRCGGWTGFGGMSQYAHSRLPVQGRTGCVCTKGRDA